MQKSGISGSSLNNYLKGREMKASVAVRLAEVCGVDPVWLIFGTGAANAPAHTVAAVSDDVSIRIYDEAEASAGFGLLGIDGVRPNFVRISKGFLEDLGLTPNHTIILNVRGDSMEPTLKTGDRIILNTAPVHMLSGVMVFVSSGLLMVKRLALTAAGSVRVISDNPIYPSEDVPLSRFRWGQPDGDDAITVIGRVAYRLQALS
ncbi:LexA family transcriptional regulator [Brytella acorum]|uniref:HTH cro/C1-type domain-containing protein n=1 Tax=Brytella acorum TaxID=2959299 RepID=A0AA35V658_9PROT|nr:S24 family peptidase [Brytella acorum]CAI9120471.1 hypothetical protein LMG32879_001304 [Brytella acorum]